MAGVLRGAGLDGEAAGGERVIKLRCIDGNHKGRTEYGPGGDGEECSDCHHSFYESDDMYEKELDADLLTARSELNEAEALAKAARLLRIREKERALLELKSKKAVAERL